MPDEIKGKRGQYGPHGVPYTRYDLPNGAWLTLYEDGRIKVTSYHLRFQVTEVMNRKESCHVFIDTKPN